MATVATMFGMTPAPVDACRVLELGCGNGSNIIPMASRFPGSRFLGIDLSPRQVAEGQEAIRALGLTNIELRAKSLMEVEDDLGPFDYQIAHGIFSWVPFEVQEKILAIAARNLAPQGVAYISYNCLPGWSFKRVIREMVLYHIRRFTETAKRIEQARAFVEHLAAGTLVADSPYARLLKEEADDLRQISDSYLFHEYLEEVNQPLYFHEFVGRAAAHGLQFLWESYQGDPGNYLPEDVKETLARLSADVIRREQNIDFLINRRFRRSLLCHDQVAIDRSLPADRLTSGFWFVGMARPQWARVDLRPGIRETFLGRGGESMATESPVGKATLACLHEASPRAVSFDELCDAVRARLVDAKGLGMVTDDDLRREIAAALRHCVWPRLVELRVHPMNISAVVGERPVGSPVARYQAMSSDRVTNLRHEAVALEPFERRVLPLHDGQRDRAALLDVLVGVAETGQIPIALDGRAVRDKESLRSILGEQLDAGLRRLASLGLIER
jgi:methyltransferase-like protein/SAM-dependent methyltransferase